MKIKLLSDLHAEFQPFNYEYHGEDVVVLAGDIHVQNRHAEILDQIPNNVRIILIAGNHEYYGGDFNEVNEWLYALDYTYPNLTYLHNNSVHINGVDFYGGTMFTDFDLYGWVGALECTKIAREGVADFRHIKKNGLRWTTMDHTDQHELFLKGLQPFLKEKHEKRVVISHFMPTEQLTHPKWLGSDLNPFFTTNMEKHMGWDGLWLCGHGHDSNDIKAGDTRVVLNPRGYPKENVYGFKPDLILEI